MSKKCPYSVMYNHLPVNLVIVMDTWLADNLKPDDFMIVSVGARFEHEGDAVVFRLRFGV